MNRTACLILFPRFSEFEQFVALSVLAQGRVNTQVFALSSDPVRGEAGLTVLPEGDLRDAPQSGLDAVIVPGADEFGHLVDEVLEGNPRTYIEGTDHVIRGSPDLRDTSSRRCFAGGSVETWRLQGAS
jgi:hypothetical protein